MRKIALLIAIFFLPAFSMAAMFESEKPLVQVSQSLKQHLNGAPVYLQIFKEENILELYAKQGDTWDLLETYPVCKYSGGLGPKQRPGDLKSPEGFYQIRLNQLKPNSQYYLALNLGFPNQYDKDHGYEGKYLMIHGECVSVGCYAMTNKYIEEIYGYVRAALLNGQQQVAVSIYPFRMTENNMQRHRNSAYINFWKQLQPGYAWFLQHKKPPMMEVLNGQYVLTTNSQPESRFLLRRSEVK